MKLCTYLYLYSERKKNVSIIYNKEHYFLMKNTRSGLISPWRPWGRLAPAQCWDVFTPRKRRFLEPLPVPGDPAVTQPSVRKLCPALRYV